MAEGINFDVSPVEEFSKSLYDGKIEYRQFRYLDMWCYAVIVTPSVEFQFHVTKYGLKICSDIAEEYDAVVVSNGGDYDLYGAVGLHVSDGTYYRLQSGYEPCVNFTKDHRPEILPWNSPIQKYNALAGKRYIVLNGQRAPNTSAAWNEVHPRTLAGVTKDGKFVVCIIDGRQPGYSEGADLFESAFVMWNMLGCDSAIDLDGGGSSTLVLNGIICNVPIDNNEPGKERAVGTHIVIRIPKPPEGVDMITGKVIATSVYIRSDHNGDAPVVGSLKANDIIEASENYYQWLKLSKINGVAVVGSQWASAGANKQYIQWSVVSDPVPGPEPTPDPDPMPPPPSMTVRIIDDSTGAVYEGQVFKVA